MAAPWYQDGLRFTCTRCGNCCTGTPGYVWVNEQEVAELAELKGVSPELFRLMYTRVDGGRVTLRDYANGDCVFYSAQLGCTVYAARPMQCRTWPFWESTAGTEDAWRQTQAKCPGAGYGELIAPEDITRRMKAIRI